MKSQVGDLEMMLNNKDTKDINSSNGDYAIFDRDRKFRYCLVRNFEKGNLDIGFIMLNPSTADHNENDPTIRRCIDIAKKLNAKKLYVLNLFAFRSTKPEGLKSTNDPTGPNNDYYLKQSIEKMDKIVVAWGGKGGLNNRSNDVRDLLINYKHKVFVLKIIKDNEPHHPLYLSKDLNPFLYFKNIKE